MKFSETKLSGAYVVDLEPIEDDRGFFARGWCKKEFQALGLTTRVAQANMSYNARKGTLRGMHWQSHPHRESKYVRCTRGAILDVIVDLRPDSSTYLEWIGVELSAQNYLALFVPEDFAHGFQTLEDNTEVHYQVSEFYAPEAEQGARFDDPSFGIVWPLPASEMSEKDARWADFVPKS